MQITYGRCAVLAMLLAGAPAHAELNCDQLVGVAQTAVDLRDQGMSLSAMMAEIERGDLRKQLDAQEFGLVRQIVRGSYLSEFSVYEVTQTCKDGGFKQIKPKPKS